MSDLISTIEAKRKAAADAARASQEAAVAKARAKKPLSDAEISKMKSQVLGGEEAPKKLKAKAKASAVVKAETPVSAPAAKPASKPRLTIAQEAGKIELPNRPLEGQGSMEGKPVTSTTVKVPEAAAQGVTPEKVKAFNAAREADRRVAQGKAPGGVERRVVPEKVITTEGKIEAPKPTSVKPAGPPKLTAADIGYETPKPPGPPQMTAHDLFGAPEGPKPSLAIKAGSKLRGLGRSVGKQLLESVKDMDPTRPYRELGPNRTSWQVAKAGVKGFTKTAKNLAEGVALQFAGEQGWKVGTAVNKAFEGDVGGELTQKRAAEKAGYRLEGTHERGWSAVGKGLVGALTAGYVEPGEMKETKLVEDPALKAKAMQSQREKIRKFAGKTYTRGPSKGGSLPQ